ncbi:MAG: PLDc N-terminal domain-containing protein [Bacteroidetes bacterium]|nr:PLDc N-terminal domain-containing protein [Bacteroidota bacterium]
MDPETIVLVVIHAVIAPVTAGHALLFKRDSRAAFGWVSACLLFPLFGPIAYALFGINRVQTRAREMHAQRPLRRLVGFEREGPFALDRAPRSYPGLSDAFVPVARLSDAVTNHPLCEGNNVSVLENGERAYPKMLEAIDAAMSSVFLMTYIFDTDTSGQRFVDALTRAASRGVDVRVIVDGFGERYSHPRVGKLLRRAGVRVVRFLPLRLFPPSLNLNLRNHRKLLIADGSVAFAGGMNIGDRHMVTMESNRKRAQDLHFEFRGTICGQLHDVFRDTWWFVTGESIASPEVVPQSGSETCRVILDGPDDNLDKLEIVLIGAIAAARKSVTIMTPYFLPSREFISVLKTASLKGVNVRVILPEKSNLPYVQWATQNVLGELIQGGVRVFRQPPPFSHAKLVVVDEYYAVVGSANIDARSLRLNFEIGIEVIGTEFAASLGTYVDRCLENASQYTLDEIDGRALPVRLRDAFCWLFQPYL